jgi:hypothetical protein
MGWVGLGFGRGAIAQSSLVTCGFSLHSVPTLPVDDHTTAYDTATESLDLQCVAIRAGNDSRNEIYGTPPVALPALAPNKNIPPMAEMELPGVVCVAPAFVVSHTRGTSKNV